MTRKLRVTPEISYLMGLFACNPNNEIGIVTDSSEQLERFVKLVMESLGVEPNKISINQHGETISALVYNSKAKKLFAEALGRRLKIFRWRNSYSANYLAALFDCRGGVDARGLYINGLDDKDALLLENLNVHTFQRRDRSYFLNESDFVSLIDGVSIKLQHMARKQT